MLCWIKRLNRDIKDILKSKIPVLSWLPAYSSKFFRPDFIAALTVWALLVPEAMAYADIAGMPPEAGLYAAPLALLAYAIFGSSKYLHVGPSSMVAALSFTVVSGLVIAGSSEFFMLTILLAFIAAIVLLLFSIFKLGIISDFLSEPVLDGFVVGVAISVAISQLDKIFGFTPIATYSFLPGLIYFIRDFGMTHWPTFVVGTVSLFALFAVNKWLPKLPASLIVLFVSVVLSTLIGFQALGIHIVGEVTGGLPPFGIPEGISFENIIMLLPGALAIALVGFAESIAIARSAGPQYDSSINSNQELLALGAANLGSSLSGGFYVDGSMSRTTASVGNGAKTQMVSVISAVAIFITALFLTPIFHNLPEATLGAIIIHALWRNISPRKITRYKKTTRTDYITAIVAAVGVLTLGLMQGLVIAIIIGLVAIILDTKSRNTAILGKVPGTDTFRNIENYAQAETYPGLLILRFDGSLIFINTPDFVSALHSDISKADVPVKIILIDAESINTVDATAIQRLRDLQEEMYENDMDIWLAHVKTDVLKTMKRAGLEESIARKHIYSTVQKGVDAYLKKYGQK